LPMYQRFVHGVGATKWRDRIIAAAYGTKWIRGKERVLAIEPDGEEVVYGLETTTGNYVVWGLASSNSGQYQQNPEPRGGAIIKHEYWQPWKDAEYPAMQYVVASLDSAYTEKEENDPSAMTVWGVFKDDRGRIKIMCMYAWEARMSINDLVSKVTTTCAEFKVDRLLIESKASGISVYQEIRRIIGWGAKFGIELINPVKQGDKVARAHAIVHLFSQEMIYIPFDLTWSDELRRQAGIFPKGSHDDLVDSATMALRYLRDMNFALSPDESDFDNQRDIMYKPKSRAIYPV